MARKTAFESTNYNGQGWVATSRDPVADSTATSAPPHRRSRRRSTFREAGPVGARLAHRQARDVPYIRQSLRSLVPSLRAASRMACISACAVGSRSVTTALTPSP